MHYTYASRKGRPALNGVNLTLEPGRLVALVGLSGSGKSTFVALLERLYDPTQGQACGPHSIPLTLLCMLDRQRLSGGGSVTRVLLLPASYRFAPPHVC